MHSRYSPVQIAICATFFLFLIPFGYATGSLLHVPKLVRGVAALVTAGMLVAFGNWGVPIFWKWVNSSIKVTTFFMHYNAERRVSVSHIEAMVAAGRYDDAAAEIDLLLTMHGLDRGLCLLAIDLHLGKFGTPARAEVLLRRMRAEQPSQWESFATQRLIDLYMANADSHPKAMTELRRMIARFPGTREASGAEACLERLRKDHRAVAS